MANLLLIDDDTAIMHEQVRQAFRAPAVRVATVETGEVGLAHVRTDPPDVVLLDVRLPDQSGLDVFRQIHAIDARIPVIFVTIVKTADTAIEAMKCGAYDYLFKPLDLQQLRRVVGEALEVAKRMRIPAVVADDASDADFEGAIVGSCPSMREVYKSIGRVAAQDVPVLITGESGTGKELIARAIYQHGQRSKASFLALNCAAIPENLLESELFGHEKGAFTGVSAGVTGCSSLFARMAGFTPGFFLDMVVLLVRSAEDFEQGWPQSFPGCLPRSPMSNHAPGCSLSGLFARGMLSDLTRCHSAAVEKPLRPTTSGWPIR